MKLSTYLSALTSLTAVLSFSGPVTAQQIIFVAEGIVTSAHAGLAPTIQVGDSFQLTYSFDASTVDTNASPNRGDYGGAVTALHISVGSYATCGLTGGDITIFDDLGSDQYFIRASVLAGVPLAGLILSQNQLVLQLLDPTQTALSSDALPVSPLNPGDFVSGGTFLSLGFFDPATCTPGPCQTMFVSSTVTSITIPSQAVPSLSMWALGALAILMIVAAGWMVIHSPGRFADRA